MRADMAKVIVERPRKKGCAYRKPKGYQRRLRRYGDDGPPAREGIKACWANGTKYFNEHLGPLRRYLDRQVGRPWDKVFAEICAHINRNSAVQDHVRDHVEDYVVVHVLLIDGAPCSGKPGMGYGRPLSDWFWRIWYVCPRTGLLRRVERTRRPRYSERQPPAVAPFVRVSDSLQCRLLDGAWHLVTLKPLPAPTIGRCRSDERDILLGKAVGSITPEEARAQYGAAVFATGKRRLARRELSQYPIPRELVA